MIHQENRETYHYEDRNTSLCITKEHNVLTRYGERRRIRKSPFNQVSFSGGNAFINAGYYNTKDRLNKSETRFLAMFNADGSISKDGYVKFEFSKERKADRFKEIMAQCGYTYSVHNTKRGTYRFYLGNRYNKLILNYTNKNKELKWKCIHELDLETFVEESTFWDYSKNGTGGRFITTKEKTADVFQVMCHLIGTKASKGIYKPKKEYGSLVYYVNFNLEKKKPFTYMRNGFKFDNPIIQDVYCLTMPKGTLVIRHNGKVSIQGNCDYSQAELRVMAWLSGDENMQKAYNSGSDLHESTMNLIYGDNISQDHDEHKRQRTLAKASNFGMVYGGQPQTLVNYIKSWGVDLPLDEAKKLHKAFFEAYPKLIEFYDYCKDYTRCYGYIRSPLGRKRWLPDIYSMDWKKKSSAERQCINSPVQGMASDICVSALADIVFSEELDHSKFTVLGSVHDAILIECKEDYAEYLGQEVAKIMSKPTIIKNLDVPIPFKGDVEIHKSWGG